MPNNNFRDIDIDLASKVQRLLFPKGSPVCSWCCVGVRNRMALGLGGDYFDFIRLDNGCQLVFLGDVTGHGLQASVVMSLLYGFLHRASANGCTPLETTAQVNRFLQYFAKRSRKFDHYFSTTLFYGIIDPDTLTMRYVNAGHVAPRVCRNGDQIFSLTATAQPLGYFAEPELEMRTFQFEKGDRMLLFTDGISESFNSRGQLFGTGRIEDLMRKCQGPQPFLDSLFQAMEDFGAPDPPEDDCTAIVMDIRGQ
jgi:sigma-B regulation protein RsbU (phosphoserine phosphatase)